MKLLLFDIDGTLVLSGGAGLRAMNQAFEHLFSIKDALTGIQLAGRTDTSIILDAGEKHKLTLDDAIIAQYKQTYFSFLPEEMAKPNAEKRAMPAVEQLLPKLAVQKDIYLGLLTGNWETSGRIKLAHFDFEKYFSFGAFADDSVDRNKLVPFALQRFEEKYSVQIDRQDVYVIGDTPADIQCAKPHGVTSVAVAAAHYSTADLAAHQPDILLDDLYGAEKIFI